MTFRSWGEKLLFWEISYLDLGKGKLKSNSDLLNLTVRGIPGELGFVTVELWIRFVNGTCPLFH